MLSPHALPLQFQTELNLTESDLAEFNICMTESKLTTVARVKIFGAATGCVRDRLVIDGVCS